MNINITEDPSCKDSQLRITGLSWAKSAIPFDENSFCYVCPGKCCESGIYDFNYSCCPLGAKLDADGNCCEQEVDVCGRCGGSAVFVDAFGSCCNVDPIHPPSSFLPFYFFAVYRRLLTPMDSAVRAGTSMSVVCAMDLVCLANSE